jgi:hypothetical protein
LPALVLLPLVTPTPIPMPRPTAKMAPLAMAAIHRPRWRCLGGGGTGGGCTGGGVIVVTVLPLLRCQGGAVRGLPRSPEGLGLPGGGCSSTPLRS